MNLREPKKKLRAKVQNKSPLPITLNETEWVVYTAYLTDIGSCIIDSDEIAAVHSMIFFFLFRDFLVRVLYQEAIHYLEKLDMEHHLLLEIGNGLVDKSGHKKLNYLMKNSIKKIIMIKIL